MLTSAQTTPVPWYRRHVGALAAFLSSLTQRQRRTVAAGALGAAGLAVWGITVARARWPGARPTDEQAAVRDALALLGVQADPEAAAGRAYAALHPECPPEIDLNDPAHRACADAWLELRDEALRQLGCEGHPRIEVYAPGSAEQIQLFRKAAELAGVPESWASDAALMNVLAAESAGQVGIPNYTYGWRQDHPACWPKIHNELRAGIDSSGILRDGRLVKSTATGLGQLLLGNVDDHYPSGRAGIGVAVEEAAGMLSYIKDRYGEPVWAWRCHNKLCPRIPGKRPKTFKEGY